MSEATNQAVFLSYASEDAGAARRVCDSLLAAGVEVWFDQSELTGGDAWDRKIREQLRTCALFVPVISAATQARREGYFRLEWKLAAQRTHTIADGTPFLLPVVIDATRDADALVPEEFRSVQWTRLAKPEALPAFVARVKNLLTPAPGAQMGTGRPRPVERDEGVASPTIPPVGRRVPAAAWSAAVAIIVAALVIGAVIWRRPAISNTDAGPRPPTAEKSTAAATVVSDKSIAVLPFANLSDDKDTNAFFADGIHEDILTGLALIRELRVVSRTSVMEYRTTTKKMRQIASELGVAYILEGSVRRSGSTVRVTGQLIRAATDEHVWAENYTKSYTAADVFAIQTELAQKIAAALQTALSPQEKSLLARRPTENSAAYELFLKGRDSRNRDGRGATALRKQEPLFQAAVDLDPNFAEAWAELAITHVTAYYRTYDKSAARLASAKGAIDRAVRLAPDSPDVIRSLAFYYSDVLGDYARAIEEFGKLVRLQPNDAAAYYGLSFPLVRQGLWPEALANRRKATRLDPGNIAFADALVFVLDRIRRFDEAMAEKRRVVALRPERIEDAFYLARQAFRARGSTRETEELLARLPAHELSSPRLISLRKDWAQVRGDLAEARRLDQLQPYFDGGENSRESQALAAAMVCLAQNDPQAARARLGNIPAELRSHLELEPANERLWREMGLAEAILGHPEEALRSTRKGVEVALATAPASLGVLIGSLALAQVHAWTGDKDHAIAELTRLLRVAGVTTIHEMKTSPFYFPLRGDPRFEALLKDPKNNAPLF